MSRRYETQQGCPVARSLDVIGDRWTLLLIRDLLRGKTKFSDLLESLEGISPNLLSARLKRLQQAEIVERSYYSDHPPRAEYHLTEKGRALGPVIRSIYQWGEEHARPATRSRGR
jgi:DNA-binding HxlR family transcriptional regulator